MSNQKPDHKTTHSHNTLKAFKEKASEMATDLRTSSSLSRELIEEVRERCHTRSASGEWTSPSAAERALHMLIGATRLTFSHRYRSDAAWEAFYQERVGEWVQGDNELHLDELLDHLKQTPGIQEEQIHLWINQLMQLNARSVNHFRLFFYGALVGPFQRPTTHRRSRRSKSDATDQTKELQTIHHPSQSK